MRYGENPHQRAALYGDFLRVAEPLHGKELSYNNVVDVDAALALARRVPAPPERRRRHPEAQHALRRRTRARSRSRPGSAPTRPIRSRRSAASSCRPRRSTLALAQAVDEIFTEVLIAPEFEPDALALLTRKKARRLVRWHPAAQPRSQPALRGVAGGLLVQEADRAMEDVARRRAS